MIRCCLMMMFLLVAGCAGLPESGPAGLPSAGQISMPHFFNDRMVVQRDEPIVLWGWGEPDTRVEASLNGRSNTRAKVTEEGRWRLELPAQKAGGPHQIVVQSENTLAFKDVMVGEVWLAAGQSNMWWPIRQLKRQQIDISQVRLPDVRMIQTPRMGAAEPSDNVSDPALDPRVDGRWHRASPETIGDFSATPFYFARALERVLDVPVGVIVSAYGGTTITQWLAQSNPARGSAHFGDKGGSGALYNGMLSPYAGLPIRGVIWYQGESSLRLSGEYARLQLMLVEQLRKAWNRPELPFYLVQLPPFKRNPRWAEIGQAQLEAYRQGSHMGIAVTNDLGDPENIHPWRKQEVGERLARWALRGLYGQQELVATGPLAISASRDGAEVHVRFDFTGKGLASSDGLPLSRWQLAGENGRFFDAEAHLEGDQVVVRSRHVETPVSVRLAFDGTAVHNLVNSEGLPASPFLMGVEP